MKRNLLVLTLLALFSCSLPKTMANDFLNRYADFQTSVVIDGSYAISDRSGNYYESSGSEVLIAKRSCSQKQGYLCAELYSPLKNQTQTLILAELRGSDFRCDIESFTFNKDYIAIFVKQHLLLFDRNNNDTLITNQKLTFGVRKLKIIDNNMYLYNADISSISLKEPSYTSMHCYSLDSLQVTNSHYFEDKKDCAFYNCLPRNVLELNENYIVHSSIIKYQMDIYDTNFNLLYSINRKPENWNYPQDTTKVNDDLARYIEKLEMTYRTDDGIISTIKAKTSQIDNVYLNGNKLYVQWNKKANRGYYSYDSYIDVWELSPDKATLIASDMFTNYSNNETEFDINNLKMDATAIVLGNKILVHNTNPFPLNELEGKTEEEYENMKKQYYLENDMKCSLYIYELKND